MVACVSPVNWEVSHTRAVDVDAPSIKEAVTAEQLSISSECARGEHLRAPRERRRAVGVHSPPPLRGERGRGPAAAEVATGAGAAGLVVAVAVAAVAAAASRER